jgi:cell division protein FtsB
MVLILLIVAAVFGDHGLIHLRHMQGEQEELEHLVFGLQQRNEHLQQQIRRLQSDDRYLEKVARERLGMVKKDELIYRVPAPIAPVDTHTTASTATNSHH